MQSIHQDFSELLWLVEAGVRCLPIMDPVVAKVAAGSSRTWERLVNKPRQVHNLDL